MTPSRRWAVALATDNPLDLKIALALFQLGDPQVAEIKLSVGRVETALLSRHFERLSVASDVIDASEPIIDAINGICFIHDPARSPLRRNTVHERLPTGDWDGGKAFVSATMSGKSRVAAFAAIRDKDGNLRPNPQSQESIWLQNATNDGRALEVLTYIRGTPDWFLLYKAYEAMRADSGESVTGWPDTDRFARSANIRRHFLGHSSAKQTPRKPFVPMQLLEATDFVRTLARQWLNSKYSAPESSRE